MRPCFKGKKGYLPTTATKRDPYIPLHEGDVGLDNAVAFLRGCVALEPLQLARGLVLASQDHVGIQSTSGSKGHIGDDGSFLKDRIVRYGEIEQPSGEVLSYYRMCTCVACCLDSCVFLCTLACVCVCVCVCKFLFVCCVCVCLYVCVCMLVRERECVCVHVRVC
jgi:hypothetical protein